MSLIKLLVSKNEFQILTIQLKLQLQLVFMDNYHNPKSESSNLKETV